MLKNKINGNKGEETEIQKIHNLFKKRHKLKSGLSLRERDIIQSYYGFGRKFRHTLKDLGIKYQVTRERIRQIKHIALHKIGYVTPQWMLDMRSKQYRDRMKNK